jgi:hypothetical protein
MLVCHCGNPRQGNELLGPLRALKPQEDKVRVMSYLEAQAGGAFLPAPSRISKRTCFFLNSPRP